MAQLDCASYIYADDTKIFHDINSAVGQVEVQEDVHVDKYMDRLSIIYLYDTTVQLSWW